jgi:hypothetical protein
MGKNATLNSRLRVLVARTYKAEKLYSSLRNAGGSTSSSLNSALLDPHSAKNPGLAQLANDARAKQWQQQHYQLRIALNDILSAGSKASLTAQVFALRDKFHSRWSESKTAIDEGTKNLIETAGRQEFAHTLKVSAELIRHKARAEACQVIAKELTAILEASGRDTSDAAAQKSLEQIQAIEAQRINVEPQVSEASSNVVQFPMRAAASGRRNR